jgi:HAD superfamily hydrolase (TIGR01509 family)
MLDTKMMAVETWIKAGRTFGIDISEEIIFESFGSDIIGAERVFKKYLGDNFPYHKIRDKRLDYTGEYIQDKGVTVIDGLYDLLDFLNEAHVLKAVATSTARERTELLLEAANVKDDFDLILCGEDVSKPKPDAEIFLEVARILQCKREACLVLEDSLNGILAASKANMLPILVEDNEIMINTEKIAYKRFKSLLEVKEFLEKSWDV